jgi:hypothetical protein
LGPWISSDGTPILGPCILIPASIFCPWISNPIPGISIFGFLISIPTSILGPCISSDGKPIFGLWISNPASIYNILSYILNFFKFILFIKF